MLKLTKTGIGLLTKQYRSVLRKCLLLNLGLCISIASSAMASVTGGVYYSLEDAQMANGLNIGKFNIMSGNGLAYFMEISADVEKGSYVSLRNSLGRVTAELISSVNNGGILRLRNSMGTLKTELSDSSFQLNGSTILATGIVAEAIQNSTALITSGGVYDALNYYYTFRVDERDEVIEFAKELRSNKKEMSSLDFMPIKSSSDLRINLIKAEDPLTFSAKTRDDSLVLMEVCHA